MTADISLRRQLQYVGLFGLCILVGTLFCFLLLGGFAILSDMRETQESNAGAGLLIMVLCGSSGMGGLVLSYVLTHVIWFRILRRRGAWGYDV